MACLSPRGFIQSDIMSMFWLCNSINMIDFASIVALPVNFCMKTNEKIYKKFKTTIFVPLFKSGKNQLIGCVFQSSYCYPENGIFISSVLLYKISWKIGDSDAYLNHCQSNRSFSEAQEKYMLF